MGKKVNKKKYYLLYSFIFLLMYYVCFQYIFNKYEQTAIWQVDALEQQYTTFVYIGKWFRSIVKTLISEHKLIIPMWDPSIGYGSDVFTTIGNAFFDPFQWLSALCPAKYSEYFFQIITIIKLYLSGLTFSLYVFHKKEYDNKFFILVGTLIYTFSGALYIFIKQPNFLNIMYLFPLLMIGVDKIWKGDKPYFYIVMFSINIINSYYFTFMMSIMIFFYCLIKYFADNDYPKSFKTFLTVIIKYLIVSIIGFGIGLGIIYPNIVKLLSLTRLSVDHYLPFIYDFNYIRMIFIGFISSYDMGSDANIGFSSLAIILIFVFIIKSDKKSMRSYFILMTLGLMVPFVGHVFNGFSYPTNRWVFGYTFLVAYLCIDALNNIKLLEKNEKRSVVSLTVFYIFSVFILCKFDSPVIYQTIYIMAFGLILILISKYINKSLFNYIILGLTCISLVFPAHYYLDENEGNMVSVLVDKDNAINAVENSGGKYLLYNVEKQFGQRYDEDGIERTRNSSMITGISGIDFYNSYYNSNIDMFHNEIGLKTGGYNYSYYGLNKRSELEYLFGVQYYLIPEDQEYRLPYGYSNYKNTRFSPYDKNPYSLYEADNMSSIIHSFSNSISSDLYKEMNPFERQNILMNYCVINNGEEVPGPLQEFESGEIKYNIIESNGVEFDGNTINVANNYSYIIVEFSNIVENEIYLYLDNIKLNDNNITTFGIEGLGLYDGKENWQMYSSQWILTPASHMYGNKHTYMLNLGHNEAPINQMKITFTNSGSYEFDDIKIFGKPKEIIMNNINRLENPCLNLDVSQNTINSQIYLDEDKYILITVPYSEGWEAVIDNESVEILKADTAFMAVKCPKGEHSLVLKYKTQNISIGLFITLVFLIIFYLYKKVYEKYFISKTEV